MKIRKRWKLKSKASDEALRKTVRAHTKSEARAFFKRMLNDIDRIPATLEVVEIPV